MLKFGTVNKTQITLMETSTSDRRVLP